ncbi:MAG: DUF3881 family protein [Eubacteriales bacterium]|nr:DUF3881 family protein [Eubacteriales bacterium]
MHKFLRAAGFSEYDSDAIVYRLIRNVVESPEYLSARLNLEDGSVLLEYRMPVNDNIGICAAILRSGREFSAIQYYYPYYNAFEISSTSICTVERHTAIETYSGVIDEYNIGLSLIFFVSNPMDYRMLPETGELREFRGTSLTAFSNEAMVLLPVVPQDDVDVLDDLLMGMSEEELYEAARSGDEDAIETIAESDINMFHQITERIESEDLYSLVEQSFMPCGVECDQYSIIGEILEIDEALNNLTGQELWLLKISSNDVEFNMCIRKDDMLGEPLVGRRIKCKLWMTGRVDMGL